MNEKSRMEFAGELHCLIDRFRGSVLEADFIRELEVAKTSIIIYFKK